MWHYSLYPQSFVIEANDLEGLRQGIEAKVGVEFEDTVAIGPGGKVLPGRRRRRRRSLCNNIIEDAVVQEEKEEELEPSLQDYGLNKGSHISLSFRLIGGAKKKGGGGGGGSAINELDEKQRKLLEMEEAKKAARAARQELKERLEVEKRNSNMNRLKIQNQWRKIMRLAKVETLRKDIEILSQNHERDLDRKDAVIQMLDRDLEESEEQFQMALRSHLEQVDALIDFHDSRLLKLEQGFDRDLSALDKEFVTEKNFLIDQHQEEVNELNGIIATIDSYEQEKEAEARQEHEQLREEIRNKSLDAINVLRITLDSQIEELEQQFENTHLTYLQNTDTRTTDFKNLTSKDQELSKEIEIKVRKIERYTASARHWRIKIAQSGREHGERNQLLLAEKRSIRGHFQKLKERMIKVREEQQKRLLNLTQEANNTQDSLKEQIEVSTSWIWVVLLMNPVLSVADFFVFYIQRASRILNLAELARKKETEREKVLAFDTSYTDKSFEKELNESIREQKEKMKRRDGEESIEPSPLQVCDVLV